MNLENNISIFTVCNVAYLNKAMVLAESLYRTNSIKIDIFLFDKKRDVSVNMDYCNLHWVEELQIPNFNILSFKYNIIELSTALKPWIALKLLKSNPKVVFFDPDVMIFNSLNVILSDLDNNPVIITPHFFYPKNNGFTDDEKIMRFGAYNLGFFSVNDSVESLKFLNWWSERCLVNCFDDAQFGVFTDQKWVGIAQCFFPFINISFNPGLNVAYWNLNERTITKNYDSQYLINDKYPLLFFHFSAFDNTSPDKLSKNKYELGNNSKIVIKELGWYYSKKLNELENISEDLSYSFDYMSDKKYISPTLRRAYASVFHLFSENHDPFDSNGIVADFAKKNYLFQKNNLKYSSQGYQNVEGNSVKMKFVYYIMRNILRIFGPNNFMSLSRLMIYLSSYQRVPDMWKI